MVKKKETKKKEGMKKFSLWLHLALVIIVLSAAFTFWLINPKIDSPLTETAPQFGDLPIIGETPTVNQTSLYPIDFPNTEEGTFSGTLNENYFKEPIDPVILLFASKTLPGFKIVYYPKEQKLVTGSPPMTAEGISIFNGIKTQLTYTFNKDRGQALFIDGIRVAEGPFKLNKGGLLTGMVTGNPEVIISERFTNVKIE